MPAPASTLTLPIDPLLYSGVLFQEAVGADTSASFASSSDDDGASDGGGNSDGRLQAEEMRRKARRVLTEDGRSVFQYTLGMPHPILAPHVLQNCNTAPAGDSSSLRPSIYDSRSLLIGSQTDFMQQPESVSDGGSGASSAGAGAGAGAGASITGYSSSGSSGYSSGGSTPEYGVPSATEYPALDLDLLSATDVQSTIAGLDFENELSQLLPSLELLNSNLLDSNGVGFDFEAVSAGLPYNGSVWVSLRYTPPPHIGAKEMPFLVLYCQSKMFWDAVHAHLLAVRPAPSWSVVWDPHNVKVFLEENNNSHQGGQTMHLHLRIVRVSLHNNDGDGIRQQGHRRIFTDASLEHAEHEVIANAISSQLTSGDAGKMLFGRNKLLLFFASLKAAASRRPPSQTAAPLQPSALSASKATAAGTDPRSAKKELHPPPPLPPPRRRVPANAAPGGDTRDNAAGAASAADTVGTAAGHGMPSTIAAGKTKRKKAEEISTVSEESTIFMAPMDTAAFNALEIKETFPVELPHFTWKQMMMNRYSNILPNPTSQVHLVESGSSFINANFVRSGDGSRAKEYIAAQGPLSTTVDAFMRMIWEQNISVVVQTTKFVENGIKKCERYFPGESNDIYFTNLNPTLHLPIVLHLSKIPTKILSATNVWLLIFHIFFAFVAYIHLPKYPSCTPLRRRRPATVD